MTYVTKLLDRSRNFTFEATITFPDYIPIISITNFD